VARFIYGGGGDGDIIKPTGVPYINASANVFDARTGGTQIADLQNISGSAITSVATDAFGQAIFYGPDNYIGVLWLDFGSGVRWAVSPKAVDLAALRAIGVQRAADAAATTPTAKAGLPYNAADPLEQALAAALDPLVIPRFASQSARDAAFPSPQGGDRCWRTDLALEQVFNGKLGLWRNNSFAYNFGSVGGSVTVANTVTETQLSVTTVPANTPAGATFKVTGYGSIVQAANATPTLTLRLKVGGVSGVSLAANSWTAATNATPSARAWQVQGFVTLNSTGASGTWFGNLTGSSTITSTTPLFSSGASLRSDGTSLTTRDSTVSQNLSLTAQWDAASASNSVIQYGWAWERVC
jgi:hypothetical protein